MTIAGVTITGLGWCAASAVTHTVYAGWYACRQNEGKVAHHEIRMTIWLAAAIIIGSFQ